MLTDNGKQFTDRFGYGVEVLFDRICRTNGIRHRLTRPASPTTTGKVERMHQTLRRELLDTGEIHQDLATAQGRDRPLAGRPQPQPAASGARHGHPGLAVPACSRD